MAYTKEFLVEVDASKFLPLGEEVYKRMYALSDKYYDKVGKDKFRIATGLDAGAIKRYVKIKNCA